MGSHEAEEGMMPSPKRKLSPAEAWEGYQGMDALAIPSPLRGLPDLDPQPIPYPETIVPPKDTRPSRPITPVPSPHLDDTWNDYGPGEFPGRNLPLPEEDVIDRPIMDEDLLMDLLGLPQRAPRTPIWSPDKILENYWDPPARRS